MRRLWIQGSRLLVLAAALVAGSPVPGQIEGAFLEALPETQESKAQDDAIRAEEIEMRWLIYSGAIPRKRCYTNLTKPVRQQYRRHLSSLIKAYWARGSINDLHRASRVISQFMALPRALERDAKAKLDVREEWVYEQDPEVDREERELYYELSALPPGLRMTPVSNTEHLLYQEALKAAHVGLGQQKIEFASAAYDTIRRRLNRFFRWGEFYDKRVWEEKLDGLAKEFRKVPSLVRLVLEKTVEHAAKTRALIKNPEALELFDLKNKFFKTASGAGGGASSITAALELVNRGEMLYAQLGKSGGTLEAPGRNQLVGLALTISGTAAAYVASPSISTMISVGAVGLVGTPLLLDLNGDGAPNLKAASWLPDGVVRREETVPFDLDGDGRVERVEWVTGGDALLAEDTSGNGIIDDGRELFGAAGGFSDGFAKLTSTRDRDGDGWIRGAELHGLLLWKDGGDGICRPGEIVTVASEGIEAIRCTHGGFVSDFRQRGRLKTMWDWHPEIIPQWPFSDPERR